MESRGSDFYNANQLENDEAKRRVIPNLPRRPQPTFIEKTNNQTNPANTLDTSFQRSQHFLTVAGAKRSRVIGDCVLIRRICKLPRPPAHNLVRKSR
ncbi:MAG: hypothetical protein DME53_03790 [Verrucomicrobia bacterium]|nr:MAG: hypothetical protein DME53_03790 [Verrucomicrobiota bacterium]